MPDEIGNTQKRQELMVSRCECVLYFPAFSALTAFPAYLLKMTLYGLGATPRSLRQLRPKRRSVACNAHQATPPAEP
jgi:hypothetical protein